MALDTETHLIGPENIAPRLVCVSLARRTKSGIKTALIGNGETKRLRRTIHKILSDPDTHVVTHSGSYDGSVIHEFFDDEIKGLLWDAYRDGRIWCTKYREKLLNISTHGGADKTYTAEGEKVELKYHLANLAEFYLGKKRVKHETGDDLDDETMAELRGFAELYPSPEALAVLNEMDADGSIPWRLSYSLLDGWKAEDYPEGAFGYALEDATDTLEIFEEQDERAESANGFASCKRGRFDAAVDFALKMTGVRGLLVDHEKVEAVAAQVDEEMTYKKMKPLYDAQLLERRPLRPYKRDLARAVELISHDPSDPETHPDGWEPHRWRIEPMGIKFVEGEPDQAKQQQLRDLVEIQCHTLGIPVRMTDPSDTHPDGQISIAADVIEELAAYNPLLGLYAERQKFDKLQSTYLPALREAKVIHPNYDVLKETGRTSSYGNRKGKPGLYPSVNIQQPHPMTRPCYKARDGYVLCSIDYDYLELCSLAQKCYDLFGHSVLRDLINGGGDPHGFLGAQLAFDFDESFRTALVDRGIEDPHEIYKKFAKLKTHKSEKARDLFKHYRTFAKPTGLGFPGGLGPATFIGYAKASFGVDLIALEGSYDGAVAKAEQLRDLWRETFPEVVEYFEWVRKQGSDNAYSYTSPFGLHRENATYCACANGAALQSPSADGAKLAMFDVSYECYHPDGSLPGGYLLAFLHDEGLFEFPEDDAHELAFIARDVMVESMSTVLTDVRVGAGPALMRNWDKRAEAVFDDNGRLIPWEDRKNS